ncbi:hypothetical protein BH747_01285 [Enterococcus villorum]|uniref:AgrB-like protein n=1 Tax=Enterococcus villorum TaxID=112904 RepID=A0A1V8YFV5_9ENTE|nr:accessory gene regulator B family protein [Enterococcus villorum]OQO71495.1 hypothetical protein BH747_01285 [Enterococcus villorum]OQO76670.1 hypothetical protein BH744_02350 [Enterococcus villorum]
MSEEYTSLEERISRSISKKFGMKLQLSELDTAKMEYGLSILLVDAFKLLFIYASAFILHIVPEVFMTHLSFVMLRRTTKSYHASNSTICTVLSIFFLVFLSFLATHFELNTTRSTFAIITLILCGVLGMKGRAITQKRVNFFYNGKIRMVCVGFFLMGIGLIQPSDQIRTLIFLGMAVATFLMFLQKRKDEVK